MKHERVPDRLTLIDCLCDVEFVEPRRCFDLITNGGALVVGITPHLEPYNTFLYMIELDSNGDRLFRDPQDLDNRHWLYEKEN